MTDHLRAADYEVRSIVKHSDVVEIVVRCHYSKSAPNTSTYRHGLYLRGCSDLLGATLWIPPTKNAAATVSGDWRSVLSLSRLVVVPGQPTNAASFLMAASMRMVDRARWPTLLTYADTGRGHTGAIYRATNWDCLGSVPAGDTWVGPDGEQRGRKRGPRTYTAGEMISLGYVRSPPMPKIKFVHRTNQAQTAWSSGSVVVIST